VPHFLEQAGQGRHAGAADGDEVDVLGGGGGLLGYQGAQYTIRAGGGPFPTADPASTAPEPPQRPPGPENPAAMNPSPRPLLLAVAAAALLLAAPTRALEPASDGEPSVVVPEPVWDAGTVPRGAAIAHDFVIHNEGQATLHLREVRPACGCTVTEYDREIAPGGQGRVRAVVETASFRGPIAKPVTVFTNDRQTPTVQLTVKAQVEPYVDVLPGYARFIHVQGQEPQSVLQTLWATDGVPLEIRGVESPFPYLRVEHRLARGDERQADGPPRQLALVATLAGEAPEGPLVGDLVVRTNHPRQREVVVPVTGYVRPLLQVTPPRADFSSFAPEGPRPASLLVINYGEQHIRVTGVTTDVPGLRAEIEEREAGKRYAVMLWLDPSAGLGRGRFNGTLTLRTDSPREPQLEVAVVGEVL
jgi:hypothetical protein